MNRSQNGVVKWLHAACVTLATGLCACGKLSQPVTSDLIGKRVDTIQRLRNDVYVATLVNDARTEVRIETKDCSFNYQAKDAFDVAASQALIHKDYIEFLAPTVQSCDLTKVTRK